MSVGSIIGTIVVGAIIGALGRLVVRGSQRISWVVTILVGVVAAFIGTWLAGLLGVDDTRGIDWIELLLQIGVAAILVALVTRLFVKPAAQAPGTAAPPMPPQGTPPQAPTA